MTAPTPVKRTAREPIAFAGARHAALAVFAVGILGSGVVATRLAESNQRLAETRFRTLAQQSAQHVTARLRIYEYGLRGVGGMVLSHWPEPIGREPFQRYSRSRDVDREFPGARGFGWIARVPLAQEEAFVAASRLDGAADFSVRTLSPHQRDRYIIQYIEPLERNLAARGLDIGSEAKRRRAAEASMQSGQATLTAPITLVQVSDKSLQSFLFMVPIYRPGAPRNTQAQREEATLGWSYAPLLMDEVLADLDLHSQVSLTLSDTLEPSAPPFFSSGPVDAKRNRGLVSRLEIPLYGRTWLAEMHATPAFVAELRLANPIVVGAVGVGSSLLLAALALVFGVSRQRKLEVQAQQARLASIVSVSTDAIIGVTLDDRITDWNEGAERLFGYTRLQVIGRFAGSLLTPPHLTHESDEIIAAMQRGRQVPPFDTVGLRSDGSLIDVSVTASPITTASGERVGFSKTMRDISDAKRVERQARDLNASLEQQVSERTARLAQTNERFAIATDSAGIGVWEFDVVRDRLKWDARMFRLYGHAPDSGVVPGLVWEQQFHPEDRHLARGDVQLALRGERDLDREFRIVWPNGDVRHLKASARVVRDSTGKPLRLTGVCVDVTERKRAELDLLETSSLLQGVLASASEFSIIAGDRDLVIRVFNRGAERLLGYASEEIVGRVTPAIIHDPEEIRLRGEELSALSGEIVEGGAVFTHPLGLQQPREWTYIRKDGSRVAVSLIVTAMRTGDGEIIGYLGVAQDVTRQKEQEASLRDAKRQAELASLAKSHFLANMSHEIRTPMNAVIALSYLLSQTTLDAEQASFLAKIRTASKSLLGVINDILDLSKIEAGELLMDRGTFALRDNVSEVAEVMTLPAASKRIALEVYVEDEVPSQLYGDVGRLKQILTNLLSNAIKFTERGSVSLRVSTARADAASATLVFEVRDSGIGMSAEAQLRVFAPFAQADASTTRRFGGTGLGLSIVKQLVDLMGGTVALVSAEGVGSLFRITLTFDVSDASASRTASPLSVVPRVGALDAVRVLVVDDSEINLDVAKRILERQGAEVVTVGSGTEAIAHLRTAGKNTDAVLMDIQMPLLDGIGTTQQIRDGLGLTALPIIALTADARTSERDRALRAGMVDFVTKPFEAELLIRIVRRHLVSRETPAQVTAHVPITARAAIVTSDEVQAWPEIEGVDLSDARSWLASDRELFERLLRHLAQDYADLTVPIPSRVMSAEQCRELSARMHKLRGASGQLGARVIHELAGRAEQAYREGDGVTGDALASQLGVQLKRLCDDVARLLPSSSLDESGDMAHVNADELATLITMLENRDLSALAYYRQRRGPIARLLGGETFARLESEMESLDFEAAIPTLAAASEALAA